MNKTSLALVPALLAAALLSPATPAAASEWALDEEGSRLVVHVFRAGLLRAFAHDHHLVPGRWRATASFEPERPAQVSGEIVVDAASLRDTQQSLSAEDRAKVDRQVAEEVLDARRFPEIRYVVTGFQPSGRSAPRPGEAVSGLLRGRLSLKGVERELSFPVEVELGEGRARVRGRAVLSREDFGVEVPSAALGTVRVKDGVEIELAVTLVRR